LKEPLVGDIGVWFDMYDSSFGIAVAIPEAELGYLALLELGMAPSSPLRKLDCRCKP
jgi:hypothetical protein